MTTTRGMQSRFIFSSLLDLVFEHLRRGEKPQEQRRRVHRGNEIEGVGAGEWQGKAEGQAEAAAGHFQGPNVRRVFVQDAYACEGGDDHAAVHEHLQGAAALCEEEETGIAGFIMVWSGLNFASLSLCFVCQSLRVSSVVFFPCAP